MELELYKDFNINVETFKRICTNTYDLKGYEKGYFQPPEYFKEESGIDVSHKFRLGGLEIRDIQLLCKVSTNDRNLNMNLGRLLIDLSRLNPEIRKIKIQRPFDIYDILMGIASMFNLEDIIFYIGRWKTSGMDQGIRNEAQMYNLLNIYKPDVNWNYQIQWVLSNSTVNKIESELIKILENGVKYTG